MPDPPEPPAPDATTVIVAEPTDWPSAATLTTNVPVWLATNVAAAVPSTTGFETELPAVAAATIDDSEAPSAVSENATSLNSCAPVTVIVTGCPTLTVDAETLMLICAG